MSTPQAPQEFLRLPEVLKRSGYSRTTLYRRIAEGAFPRWIKDGRIALWPSREVDAWQAEKLAAGRA
jgi:hypothetical protein